MLKTLLALTGKRPRNPSNIVGVLKKSQVSHKLEMCKHKLPEGVYKLKREHIVKLVVHKLKRRTKSK